MKALELENIIKDNGFRCTKQRLAILKVMNQEKCPLSARNIFDKLKGSHPKLRLSTVYRNLNYFVEKQIVRKLNITEKESMFELIDGQHHHHLICVRCREIIPINCPLREYEGYLSKKTNYKIKDHKLKIYGICPDCQKNK